MADAPTTAELEEILKKVRPLCLQAGQELMHLLKGELVTSRKADHSLVTNADHAANDILRKGLQKLFPEHARISEESGLDGSLKADFLWLIDPLDGTKAYAKGAAGFSVQAGLLFQKKPVLGIVYDPMEGNYYEAVRGGGARYIKNQTELALVSARREWNQMPVITSTGFPEKLKSALQAVCPAPFLAPINSVGVKVGYMVRQFADIYVNHHPVHYWDTCAPLLILREAGGVMTHWDGSPLDFENLAEPRHPHPTLASNGLRHRELVDIVARLTIEGCGS